MLWISVASVCSHTRTVPESSWKLREKHAEEREGRRESLWSGLWFVNVGMDDPNIGQTDEAGHGNIRHWLNCVQYGYIAAGGGPKYSAPLRKLEKGAEIMAYQAVGATWATAWSPARHSRSISFAWQTATMNRPDHNARQPEDRWEYAIGVQWKKYFVLSQAKTFDGVFASPLVVCKLNDAETARFVRREFQIPDPADA